MRSGKVNNPDGDVIRNRAGIYFDFNLPVITNETWHTVGLPQVSGVSDLANKKIPGLLCSPNPFSERFWVTLKVRWWLQATTSPRWV